MSWNYLLHVEAVMKNNELQCHHKPWAPVVPIGTMDSHIAACWNQCQDKYFQQMFAVLVTDQHSTVYMMVFGVLLANLQMVSYELFGQHCGQTE